MKTLEREAQIEGVVTGVLSYAAFVDCDVKKDGMLHVSEAQWLVGSFVHDLRDRVKVGDRLTLLYVLDIDEVKERFTLTTRAPSSTRHPQGRVAARTPEAESKTLTRRWASVECEAREHGAVQTAKSGEPSPSLSQAAKPSKPAEALQVCDQKAKPAELRALEQNANLCTFGSAAPPATQPIYEKEAEAQKAAPHKTSTVPSTSLSAGGGTDARGTDTVASHKPRPSCSAVARGEMRAPEPPVAPRVLRELARAEIRGKVHMLYEMPCD